MEVVNVFDTYLAEVEYEVDVPSMYAPAPEWEPPVRIGISAVGGGTLGEAYAWNTWIWGVWSRGELVLCSDDLKSSGVAATHETMAKTLCAFLASDGEIMSRGGNDDHLGGYWPAQREFLESEHERLASFAYAGTAYERDSDAQREFAPDPREVTDGIDMPSYGE